MKRLERRFCAFDRNIYMVMNWFEPKIVIPRMSAISKEVDNNGSLDERKKIVMDIYNDTEIPAIKDAIKNKGLVRKKERVCVLNHMLVEAYERGNVEIVDSALDKEVDYRYASFLIHFGKKKREEMSVDICFETKSMTCNVFISISVKYMMKSDEWFMNKLIKGIARNVDTFRNGDAYGRFKDEEVAALMQIASDYLCNETCMPIIEFKF